MLLKELKALAKESNIKGYSKMKKADLEKRLTQSNKIKSNFKLTMINCNENREEIFTDCHKNEVIQEMLKIKRDTGNRYKIYKITDKDNNLLAFSKH